MSLQAIPVRFNGVLQLPPIRYGYAAVTIANA